MASSSRPPCWRTTSARRTPASPPRRSWTACRAARALGRRSRASGSPPRTRRRRNGKPGPLEVTMIRTCHFAIALSFIALACRELPQATSPSQPLAVAQSTSNARNPAWWNKYLFLAENGPMRGGAPTASTGFDNVDVSNECGPQSETYITLNPNGPRQLTAGSNEIFRLPMRAYFSSDGGSSWGGADVPLPPPLSGTNDTRFGSDPTLAFDTQGNVFYGFIVVFFSATFNTPSNGVGINGTELAVARSSDGGSTWPRLTQFSFEPGENHFNDKPMITVDGGDASRFSDNVYVAWDADIVAEAAGVAAVHRDHR